MHEAFWEIEVRQEPDPEIGGSSGATSYVTVQPADWREEPLPTPPPPALKQWKTLWLLRRLIPPSGGFFLAL